MTNTEHAHALCLVARQIREKCADAIDADTLERIAAALNAQAPAQAPRYEVAEGDTMVEDGVRDAATGLVLSASDIVAMLNAAPAQAPQDYAQVVVLVKKWREQANAALRRSGMWNGNDMADRIERMADELAAMLAAAPAQQPAAAVPERGLRDSVLNSAKFRASCYALVGIVEGIQGLGRCWAANGERLKDTPEWVAFYNCVASMRNGTFNQASAEQAQQPADAWINLYRRAIDVANDLTNYVEDRPKLLGAERKLDAIENEARALIAANKENSNG